MLLIEQALHHFPNSMVHYTEPEHCFSFSKKKKKETHNLPPNTASLLLIRTVGHWLAWFTTTLIVIDPYSITVTTLMRLFLLIQCMRPCIKLLSGESDLFFQQNKCTGLSLSKMNEPRPWSLGDCMPGVIIRSPETLSHTRCNMRPPAGYGSVRQISLEKRAVANP